MSENILDRVKLLIKYDLKKTLTENITEVAGGGFGLMPSKSDPKSKEEGIINDILKASKTFGGTDEKLLTDTILRIENAEQFWNVNAGIKRRGYENGIIGILNGEFESDDVNQYVKPISEKLKSLGIENNYTTYGKINITKINKTPTTTTPPAAGATPGQGNTKKPKYTQCANGNYKYMCRDAEITRLQRCLGLPKKYQTGNFGPITLKKLKGLDREYGKNITKGDIDKICSQDLSGTEKIPDVSPIGQEVTQTQYANQPKVPNKNTPKQQTTISPYQGPST